MWHARADALLVHRGPDGRGHYVDNHCELVHRRLAIIDLSETGTQPMWNEDHTVCVVFNGEIYNHRDLRARLIDRGHVFRSTSDTEVLVHLYEEDGDQMASHLKGMFAFAIYDRPKRRLLLARDRFGIKPLYYLSSDDQFVFASEIKAILALDGFKPRIDRQSCYDYLGLGYVAEPSTAFSGIKALPKGSALAVNATGQHLWQFARLEARPNSEASVSHIVESMATTLTDAVKSQSIADVPVAALLSGGIDSGLIVAAYCKAAHSGPDTFNVKFPDREYDETRTARTVSSHCGTRHRTIDLSDFVITPELVEDLLNHFDQPFADTSLIPTYLVCKSIRERGFVCALSGDGGDEAFGGYARFWRANKLMQLMRAPDTLLRLLVQGRHLANWTRDVGRQLGKAAKLARAGKEDASILIAGLSNYLDEGQKRELVLPSAREDLRPVYCHFDGYSRRTVSDLEELSARMTESLFSVGLPSDMLRKVDMMSMLASVEIRVPMLDEKVVEVGLSLPHRLKTDGHNGKLVLRSLAKRWLPTGVATHRKHGFAIPLDRMAGPQLHEWLAELLLGVSARIRTFINRQVVSDWLRMFKDATHGRRAGTISRGGLYQRVFFLVALELWLRKHRLTW
jgi:asparagine synthase (glutamine-hydrolysing)